MSTENEELRNDSPREEKSESNHESKDVTNSNTQGTSQQRDDHSYRPRFSRDSESSDRPYRPRYNNNTPESGNRPYHPPYNSYNNRNSSAEGSEHPSRPRYNGSNGESTDRPYRPRYNSNNGESTDRPYRPRYNSNHGESTDRPYRPRYNSSNGESTDHPYRPRYNSNNGESTDRPYRPRYNSNNGESTDRPYRPRYNSNNGESTDRPYRPRYNNNNGESTDRPYRPRYNSNNGEAGNRPYRPRYNNDERSNFNRPIRRTDDYDPNAKYSLKKQIIYKEENIDPNEPIRLNKYLANAGICSRREADEFITTGVVSVNGIVVNELGTKIKRSDEVKFHDQVVISEHKVYVLLNKPKDCVTTSDDPQARLTVMQLVKEACKERIYPVGRLDRNTTGVLLLTNDGDLASKLTHPKFMKKKIYQVTLDNNLTKADMDQILSGIKLEDGEIKADDISYTDEVKHNQVGIEIHSGKNRIVRRLFESLGYKVIKLDRVFFASLTKKGLRRGEWRYLTEEEVNFLRMGSFE
ncbi:MAG: pseudouridine synthase [Bacteroidaceae bacterium]|nr:pseudouridine synthase [Bacteroidaceae bacterium]